jgi:hypothetical protein
MTAPRDEESDLDIDFNNPPDDETEREPAWDADDERRQRDQMAPPREPCECYCLHCHRTLMSDQMWFQRVINSKDGFDGFWMCPTPNCGGAGFTFDIFPTDPDHPANAGWHSCDDDDEDDPDGAYDPEETTYKQLDEEFAEGGGDDDLEGEEWKYGLQSGEQLPEPEGAAESRRAWEEEQKKYDEPDRRPRILDWSESEGPARDASADEDDIPF